MAMDYKYWAHFKERNVRKQLGPFTSHEEAMGALALIKPHPRVKSFFTGYGDTGAYFDIRFHNVKRAANFDKRYIETRTR
jgi:hypothetical protein